MLFRWDPDWHGPANKDPEPKLYGGLLAVRMISKRRGRRSQFQPTLDPKP